MSDNLKLFVAILPEIVIFMGAGIFVKTTKKVNFLTIISFNANNLNEEDIKLFSNSLFKRMLIASGIIISTLIFFEILLSQKILGFENCEMIIFLIAFFLKIGLVISLISLGLKFDKD